MSRISKDSILRLHGKGLYRVDEFAIEIDDGGWQSYILMTPISEPKPNCYDPPFAVGEQQKQPHWMVIHLIEHGALYPIEQTDFYNRYWGRHSQLQVSQC